MSKLTPCGECQRHIRENENACPFCGEPAANPSPGSSARKALLTGALVTAATLACESKAKQEPPPMPYGAPPPVEIEPEPAPLLSDAAPADASAADASPPDAAPKKKRRKRKAEKAKLPESKKRQPPPKMPYGAPPARHRLV